MERRGGVERRGEVEGSGPSATRIQSSVGYKINNLALAY